jgi:hypothetical protein
VAATAAPTRTGVPLTNVAGGDDGDDAAGGGDGDGDRDDGDRDDANDRDGPLLRLLRRVAGLFDAPRSAFVAEGGARVRLRRAALASGEVNKPLGTPFWNSVSPGLKAVVARGVREERLMDVPEPVTVVCPIKRFTSSSFLGSAVPSGLLHDSSNTDHVHKTMDGRTVRVYVLGGVLYRSGTTHTVLRLYPQRRKDRHFTVASCDTRVGKVAVVFPFHYPKSTHTIARLDRCTRVSLHEALRSNGRQHDGLELCDGAGEVGA